MRTPHGSPLSFRTVHRLLSWCSSYTKYSQTTLWRFLPDYSFTRLILPDILSQSMEWTECLISRLVIKTFEKSSRPRPCPPGLETKTKTLATRSQDQDLGHQVSRPRPWPP